MIRQLTGTIGRFETTSIIFSVNGVGYLVFTPRPNEWPTATEVTVYTHLAVRETALDLYGFATTSELELFELLLTLPKIGPKSALQIMSTTSLELITEAVTNEDAGQLTKLAGLGKKTAEKVVAGLKDKLAPLTLPGTSPIETTNATWQRDAIDALIALGYPEVDARKTVQALPATISTSNEAVRTALQTLSQS